MELQRSSPSCDDGFNEFVQDRTSKYRNYKLHSCDANKDSSEDKYVRNDTISELSERTTGSGCESNGDSQLDDLEWYKNEKQIKDSWQSSPILIHTKSSSKKRAEAEDLSTNKPRRISSLSLQFEHADSFDSNKEVNGSEHDSPLSFASHSIAGERSTDISECPTPSHAVEQRDWDDESEVDEKPTGIRWPPLGAPNDEEDNHSICSFEELGRSRSEAARLRELEEEQEQLNTSLMALTSHFAQVQFRLKQIVQADSEEQERLLRELEEFADRGIPDVRAIQQTRDAVEKRSANLALSEQRELIERLKQQLDELEQYAYSAGEAGPPQAVLVHKQRLVLEQLKCSLPLKLEDIARLSPDDLRAQVDDCVRQLVNPLKMKEQLVSQLQTQVGDLERFIDLLQDEGLKKLPSSALSSSKCNCGGHVTSSSSARNSIDTSQRRKRPGTAQRRTQESQHSSPQQLLRDDTAKLMSRATLLLNMLRFAQLGCGNAPRDYEFSSLRKPTPKGPSWSDGLARLESAVDSVLAEVHSLSSADCTSDSEAGFVASRSETSYETSLYSTRGQLIDAPEVTLLVRKQLVPSLRDLLHHGLMPTSSSRSLVQAWTCLPVRSNEAHMLLHAWDVVLRYYRHKHGDLYNTKPARRLSQSFNLELSGSGAGAHKGALLAAVGNLLTTHTPLKRSPDSHLKALVSEALNQQRLCVWLRLILHCREVVAQCYLPWSCVQQTGFEDALKILERLQQVRFNLPVDLAVRSLRNINDAF